MHTRHKFLETGKQIRNKHEGDRGYYWHSAKVGNSRYKVGNSHKFKQDIQHIMPSVNVITFSESKYSADSELNNGFISHMDSPKPFPLLSGYFFKETLFCGQTQTIAVFCG